MTALSWRARKIRKAHKARSLRRSIAQSRARLSEMMREMSQRSPALVAAADQAMKPMRVECLDCGRCDGGCDRIVDGEVSA